MDVGHWTPRQHPRLPVPADRRTAATGRSSRRRRSSTGSTCEFLRAARSDGRCCERLEEKVDPQHAALVVVDVQNDFCADDGAMAQIGRAVTPVQAMVPVLQRLLDARARAGVPVIFVQYGHTSPTESEVHLEQRSRGPGRHGICRQGTWGAELLRARAEAGRDGGAEAPLQRVHRHRARPDPAQHRPSRHSS